MAITFLAKEMDFLFGLFYPQLLRRPTDADTAVLLLYLKLLQSLIALTDWLEIGSKTPPPNRYPKQGK